VFRKIEIHGRKRQNNSQFARADNDLGELFYGMNNGERVPSLADVNIKINGTRIQMFDQVRALKQAADQVRTLINWKSANRVIQRRRQLTITTSMRTSDHAGKAKKRGQLRGPASHLSILIRLTRITVAIQSRWLGHTIVSISIPSATINSLNSSVAINM
jgi:hypothetical protein